MTIEADFLTTAADKLAENLDRIETCLAELPSHALWARDSENENAVGNLLLHLEGNVRQWILSGIGAGPDERDRPSEFSARIGESAEVLGARLRGTVGEAVNLLRSLPHQPAPPHQPLLPCPADPHAKTGSSEVPPYDVGDDGLILDHHDEPACRTDTAGDGRRLRPTRVGR